MPDSATPTSARLLLLAAAALFSTGGAVIKSCSFSGSQVASFRSAVALLTLLALLPAARRGWNGRTLLVGLFYAATLILFVQATKLTTAAHAIFLQSTAPLYVVAFGPLWLGERARRSDLAFLLVVAAGMGLLFLGSGPPSRLAPQPLLGNLLATAAGAAWAGTVMGLRWLGRGSTPATDGGGALAAVAAGNLIACLVLLPWALPLPAGSAGDWLAVVFLGTIQIGLAYVCLTAGIRRLPALEASLLLLLEPVLNPIGAWLLHGENPGAWSAVGGALILAATLVRTAAGASRPPSTA